MHRHQSLQPYTTYRVRETRERPHSDLVTHQDQFATERLDEEHRAKLEGKQFWKQGAATQLKSRQSISLQKQN